MRFESLHSRKPQNKDWIAAHHINVASFCQPSIISECNSALLPSAWKEYIKDRPQCAAFEINFVAPSCTDVGPDKTSRSDVEYMTVPRGLLRSRYRDETLGEKQKKKREKQTFTEYSPQAGKIDRVWEKLAGWLSVCGGE